MVKLWVILAMSGLVVLAKAQYENPEAAFRKNYARPKYITYPANNAYSKEREELGKALFFDPRLSGSNMISCASCHNPSFAWGDALPLGVGHAHKILGRKTPTILNLADTPKLFWDGRAASLEEQALGPIASEGEMNQRIHGKDGLVEELKQIKGYQQLFAAAYPGEPISAETIAKAIATYERGVVSGIAPFDKFVAGDEQAISESARRGFVLFNTKASCVSCHSGWSLSDGSFHDIGMNDKDIGRGQFLKLKSMQHAFKTPGLRNIALRGPYMHNGREKTLESVIEFYDRGGDVKRESLSAQIRPLKLTASEKADLVNFLTTLTSQDKPVELPVLPR